MIREYVRQAKWAIKHKAAREAAKLVRKSSMTSPEAALKFRPFNVGLVSFQRAVDKELGEKKPPGGDDVTITYEELIQGFRSRSKSFSQHLAAAMNKATKGFMAGTLTANQYRSLWKSVENWYKEGTGTHLGRKARFASQEKNKAGVGV